MMSPISQSRIATLLIGQFVTNVAAHSDGVLAIIERQLHQGFARSRSIRHRDWRENQSNTRPKLGPVSTHLLRACLNEFGEAGVYDPLNQGAVVDVGVR